MGKKGKEEDGGVKKDGDGRRDDKGRSEKVWAFKDKETELSWRRKREQEERRTNRGKR